MVVTGFFAQCFQIYLSTEKFVDFSNLDYQKNFPWKKTPSWALNICMIPEYILTL